MSNVGEPLWCVCGEPEGSPEHIPQLGGTHAFSPEDTMSCISTGTGSLCGKQNQLRVEYLGWAVREFVTCEQCKLLIALADANGLSPASEPSLRAALERVIRENSIVLPAP